MTDAAPPTPPDELEPSELEGDDVDAHAPPELLELHEALEWRAAVDEAEGVGG